jgi:hypothetical protein
MSLSYASDNVKKTGVLARPRALVKAVAHRDACRAFESGKLAL